MKKIVVFLSLLGIGLFSLTGQSKDQVLGTEADVTKTITAFSPHNGFEALYIYAKKNDADKNFSITVTTVSGATKSKETYTVPYGIFYPLYQKVMAAGILKAAFR